MTSHRNGADDSPLLDLWASAVDTWPTRPALVAPGRSSITFAEIAAAAHNVRDDLIAAGIQQGDALVLGLERGPAWLPALLGIWHAGAVAVPAQSGNGEALTGLAEMTQARAVMTTAPAADPLSTYQLTAHQAAAEPSAGPIRSDHAYAMRTSGSTGSPKLALITHRTCAAVLSGLRGAVGIAPDDHALHIAAFTFSSSIRQFLLPLLSGARVTVAPGQFDPVQLLHTIAEGGISSLDLTPSHLAGLVHVLETDPQARTPLRLRRLLVASESLSPALLARWRDVTASEHELVHLYGQTETGGAISALRHADIVSAEDTRIGLSVPFAPFSAHFVSQPDGPNELLLGGLDLADGILEGGTLDRGAYTNVGGTFPLLRTGDVFWRSAAGQMTFAGRADATTKILGVRVDAEELEQRVARIPEVDRAVAFGVERDGGGTELWVAYATGAPVVSELDDRVADAAAAYLGPMVARPRIVHLTSVPLTTSGKVDRSAIRALASSSITSHGLDGSADVAAALWRRFANPAAHDTDDFFATGGDSLSMIALLAEVARTCAVRILPTQFRRDPTLSGLRTLISAAGPQTVSDQPPQPDSDDRDRAMRPGTPLQRGVLISEQLTGAGSRYWLAVDMLVDGHLDQRRLTAAFQSMLARFDALCVQFAMVDHDLVLVPGALDPATAAVDVLPNRDIADPPGLTSMLAAAQLIRLAVHHGTTDTFVALRVHHGVADRRSVTRILRELCAEYTRQEETRSALLPPADRAASFLRWMDESDTQASPDDRTAAARYWRDTLPSQRPASDLAGTGSWHRATRALDRPNFALAPATTRFSFWLAMFHQAVVETGVPLPDLVGIDIDLRVPQTVQVVGPCVVTLPVVLGHHRAITAAATADAIAALLPHVRVPLTEVTRPDQRPTGDPRQPFFFHKLVYQDADYPNLSIAGRPVTYLRLPAGIPENTTTLFVREARDRTDLEIAWLAESIDRDIAVNLLDRVVAFAAADGASAKEKNARGIE